jgi:regulator of protease activity HflC (stomatin/prohibitin superfamily)
VQGTLKEVIGQWDAVDLIQHRADAGIEVTKRITAALATKFINVNSFEITDLQYSGAFNKSIEDKVIAQQSAIREQNHTVEVQQLANQQVIQATAEAKSMQIRAEALSQNPKLVEWEAVQKWNGELPTQMFGGTVPFINVSTGQK